MTEPSKLTPKHIIIIFFAAVAIGAGLGLVYLSEKYYFAPLREQKQITENLKKIVARLTKDSRIAEVAVISQTGEPLRTKFKFIEVDEKGAKIGEARVFDVEGDEVYFDTLVIKFEDKFKPEDDSVLKKAQLPPELFNKSIILFRRVFSDKQKPEEGFPLDTPDRAPELYAAQEVPDDFESKLWSEFWELANDPKRAQEHGVRAAHGQAVSMKLRPEKYYVLERKLTGDLTIRPVDIPAVMRK